LAILALAGFQFKKIKTPLAFRNPIAYNTGVTAKTMANGVNDDVLEFRSDRDSRLWPGIVVVRQGFQ